MSKKKSRRQRFRLRGLISRCLSTIGMVVICLVEYIYKDAGMKEMRDNVRVFKDN